MSDVFVPTICRGHITNVSNIVLFHGFAPQVSCVVLMLSQTQSVDVLEVFNQGSYLDAVRPLIFVLRPVTRLISVV